MKKLSSYYYAGSCLMVLLYVPYLAWRLVRHVANGTEETQWSVVQCAILAVSVVVIGLILCCGLGYIASLLGRRFGLDLCRTFSTSLDDMRDADRYRAFRDGNPFFNSGSEVEIYISITAKNRTMYFNGDELDGVCDAIIVARNPSIADKQS